VVVEILFRRDVERLARRWQLPRLAAAAASLPGSSQPVYR
jgi:hypothetical protein